MTHTNISTIKFPVYRKLESKSEYIKIKDENTMMSIRVQKQDRSAVSMIGLSQNPPTAIIIKIVNHYSECTADEFINALNKLESLFDNLQK